MQISLPRTQRNMANGNIFCFPTVPQRVETIKMGAIVKLSRPRTPSYPTAMANQSTGRYGRCNNKNNCWPFLAHTPRVNEWVGSGGKRWVGTWVELLVHLHNKTYLNIIIIRHRVAHATTQADAATAARAHCHQTTVRAFVDHEDLREREREDNGKSTD